MKKIFNDLLVRLGLKCGHQHTDAVILWDRHFDFMMDNDDAEDYPTLSSVTYCQDCGRILDVRRAADARDLSRFWDIDRYAEITGHDVDRCLGVDKELSIYGS